MGFKEKYPDSRKDSGELYKTYTYPKVYGKTKHAGQDKEKLTAEDPREGGREGI